MKKIFLLMMMFTIIFFSIILSGEEKKPGDIYAKETVVAGSPENCEKADSDGKYIDDSVQIIHGFSFTYSPGRNFISGSVNLIKVF